MIPKEILDKIDSNRKRYVDELAGFLAIPSVSTYSHHRADVRRAGEWVLHQVKRLGFQGGLFETGGHPVVFAQRCPHPDRPTLLVYGHYDVQPPEPKDEWVSPPFTPSIRDGYIYARGASDDKGQFFTYIKAVEAVLAVAGELPINVKILAEGEEEIGSPNLPAFLKKRRDDLKADAMAVSDGAQFARGVPAITYGLRGLSYFQLDVRGPRFDLHSGSFGGLVTNPALALSSILAKLKDENGAVALPGFYDDVVELEEWERREMASLPFDEEDLKRYLGVKELDGEKGYTPLERKTARPTLDVNGIWGGFAGEGAKTIIPARAGAKISMRLVPNQTPKRVNALFEGHVRTLVPSGIRVDVKELHGAEPVLIARDLKEIQAASRAIQVGFGKTPVFIREGGSIPVINIFKERLGLEAILMMGWGSPDDGAHSPNERFHLEDFHRGIRAAAALLYELL
ncbi:dipeptidase [Desulfoglaeba alkanexedens]|jgi:acetylornithine deacetylase/succinyl-diaminopimelate desuccinylase-like protein|uniref:Dipeptidase n=1 Tax=Desulfoglaeba alkanexedens ALDC TaxID=980445 RepID=A0A4P8L206_9BACT|nr:dipeptidase [Desulfoglaeba alkanexedens]QCQ20955.1 dipeptidase [Desulfoglaeba alkanexedens ALDC]